MPHVSLAEFVTQITQLGAIGSFPTDTVPALAAAPSAAAALYAAKQRQFDKPLILMAGEIEQIWDYVGGDAAARSSWRSLMQQYWPGALTLVLPSSDRLPLAMNPLNPGTVGVRIPDHALARHILRQTGPLATTSANRTGEPALLAMQAIAQAFPAAYQLSPATLTSLDLPIEQCQSSGTASTVAQWQGDGWTILRQGAVILP
jgi:L-threonylcarbamoyladenylate synthase